MFSDKKIKQLNESIIFNNYKNSNDSITNIYLENIRRSHRISLNKNNIIRNQSKSIPIKVSDFDNNNKYIPKLPNKYNRVHPYTLKPMYKPSIQDCILTPFVHTFYYPNYTENKLENSNTNSISQTPSDIYDKYR